jgi:hypothetical protein
VWGAAEREEQRIEKQVDKQWKQMNISCHLVLFVVRISSVCGRDVTNCGRSMVAQRHEERAPAETSCASSSSSSSYFFLTHFITFHAFL